ncbi:MAG: hypothetical protein KJ624_04245 [Chloroflexi bacterium]|nr:hypothetical protein [Chloroflexota bacterium]
MDAFLGLGGLLAMLVGVAMLAINAIRKRGLRNWVLVAGGGFCLFVVGLALSSETPPPTPLSTPGATIRTAAATARTATAPPRAMSPDEYKADCRSDLAFNELDKSPDKYKGIKVAYKGEIVQIMERGQSTTIRMNITKATYGWDDTIYVTYDGITLAVEDDIVQIWGEVQGAYTYESIAGWKVTLPWVKAKYVEEISTGIGPSAASTPALTPVPPATEIVIRTPPAPTLTVTLAPQQGYSRLNPAPIGTDLAVSMKRGADAYDVRVTLQEVIRGEEAWKRIQAANRSNDAPTAGFEYILARIRFEYSKGPSTDASYYLSEWDFKAISSEGRQYEDAVVVLPEPQLSVRLYAGAWHEGWAAVIVAESDAKPVLTFARNYDGTGGIWFQLY